MKSPSLKERIVSYLEKRGTWTCGADLQMLAANNGYEPSNAARRLRECVEDGDLEVEYRKGQKKQDVAYYRAKHPKKKVAYYAEGKLVLTRWE